MTAVRHQVTDTRPIWITTWQNHIPSSKMADLPSHGSTGTAMNHSNEQVGITADLPAHKWIHRLAPCGLTDLSVIP